MKRGGWKINNNSPLIRTQIQSKHSWRFNFRSKRFHFNLKLKSSFHKPIAEAKPNKHTNTED